MTVPTIHEAVELVPELYDALRERDSMANFVCENLNRGHRPHEAMKKWKAAMAKVKSCMEKAMELKANPDD